MERESFAGYEALINRPGFTAGPRGRPTATGPSSRCTSNDRPIVWACDTAHWPPGLWRGALPSQSCMSRRMATERFARHVLALERAIAPTPRGVVLLAALDGKPIPVAWHSTDNDARRGRGAGALARGYKPHTLLNCTGTLLAWWLTGLDEDERTIAHELPRQTRGLCDVVADSNYNSNPLFETACACGARLIAPRKNTRQGKAVGNHRRHEDRLRSIEMLEKAPRVFALDMLRARGTIERFFANLTDFGGGLTHLPPWVRSRRRVLPFTAAKLTLFHLKPQPIGVNAASFSCARGSF